jgi:hypothetical protein
MLCRKLIAKVGGAYSYHYALKRVSEELPGSTCFSVLIQNSPGEERKQRNTSVG